MYIYHAILIPNQDCKYDMPYARRPCDAKPNVFFHIENTQLTNFIHSSEISHLVRSTSSPIARVPILRALRSSVQSPVPSSSNVTLRSTTVWRSRSMKRCCQFVCGPLGPTINANLPSVGFTPGGGIPGAETSHFATTVLSPHCARLRLICERSLDTKYARRRSGEKRQNWSDTGSMRCARGRSCCGPHSQPRRCFRCSSTNAASSAALSVCESSRMSLQSSGKSSLWTRYRMICVHISRGRGGHREGFVVTGTTATGVGRRGAFMRFSMVAVAVIVRILAYSDLSLN